MDVTRDGAGYDGHPDLETTAWIEQTLALMDEDDRLRLQERVEAVRQTPGMFLEPQPGRRK